MNQFKKFIPNAGLHHAPPPPRFIDFRLEEFSKKFGEFGSGVTASSRFTEIEDFKWRIIVKVGVLKSGEENVSINESKKRKMCDSENKYLGIYLQCRCKLPSPTWSIKVSGDIILRAQENENNFIRGFHRIFNASCTDWGLDQFIAWDKVTDPELGFLTNDVLLIQVQFPMNPMNIAAGIFKKSEQPTICNTPSRKSVDTVEIEKMDTENASSPSIQEEKTLTLRMDVGHTDRIESEIFKLNELSWVLIIEAKTGTDVKELEFYLQCRAPSEDSTWTCFTSVELTIVSQKEGIENFSRKIEHTFSSSKLVSSPKRIMSWEELKDPKRGFIKGDVVNFQGHVKTWDSKTRTEFVGLKNRNGDSSISFINSLVQVLFFANKLRKAMFAIPGEKISTEGSAIMTLQLLFHDLQLSKEAVEAEGIASSFGPREALKSSILHNVPEFLRFVLFKLETEIQNIGVENIISELFVGVTEYVLKCHAIDREAKSCQTFYGIELDVVNKNDIYDSFNDFVKDSSGEHVKNRLVQRFPPVLFIHLKRFVQNPASGTFVKCNNRFKFYKNVVLDKYLRNPGKRSTTYTLHAVLVHSCEKFLDHFTVFIDPKNNGEWYKFEDDVVLRCSKREAIEMNYGGEVDDANAFMLVYIRDSEVKNILQDVTKNDISSELEARIQEEKKKENIRKMEEAQAHFHNFVSVNVYLEDSFLGHQGYDLFDVNRQIPSKKYKVKETSLVKDVLALISLTFGCQLEQIRIWPLLWRPNKTYRPIYLDTKAVSKKLSKIFGKESWNFFLEISVVKPLPPFRYENEVLVFFKLYDPQNVKITYCGHDYLRLDSSVNDLIKLLKEKATYPPNVDIEIYEEIDPERSEKLIGADEPLSKALEDLSNGDIFVFQKRMSELPNCVEYFKNFVKKVEVVFENLDSPSDPDVTVELPAIVSKNIIFEAAVEKANIVKEVEFTHCKIKYRKSK